MGTTSFVSYEVPVPGKALMPLDLAHNPLERRRLRAERFLSPNITAIIRSKRQAITIPAVAPAESE